MPEPFNQEDPYAVLDRRPAKFQAENFGQTQRPYIAPPAPEYSLGETLADVSKAPFRGIANSFIDGYNLIADGVDHVGLHWLPQVDKFTSSTTAGQFTSDLFQIGAGFVTGGQILRGVGLAAKFAEAGALGRFGYNVAQGALSNFAFFSPESNFSNLLKGWGANSVLLDALAIDKDDSELDKRIKSAVEGAGIGAFADITVGALKTLSRYQKGRAAFKFAVEQGIEQPEKFAEAVKKGLLDAHELHEQLKTNLIPKDSPLRAENLAKERDAASKLAGLKENPDSPQLFNFTPGTGESATADAVVQHYQGIAEEAIKGGADEKKLLRENADTFFDNMGMSKGEIDTFLIRMEADKEAVKNVTGKLMGYNAIMKNLSKDLKKALEPVSDFTKLSPQELAAYVDKIETTANYVRHIKGIASYYGKGLNSFRGRLNLEPIVPTAKPPETSSFFAGIPFGEFGEVRYTPDKAIEYINSKGGAQKVANLLKFHRENILRDGEAALRNTEAHVAGRAWDVAAEYYVNALLSHGQTHVINFLGNMFTTMYRPLETIAGGLIMGTAGFNPKGGLIAIKDGLRNWAELNMTFLDTLGLFGGRYGGDTVRQAVKDSFVSGRSTLLANLQDGQKYSIFNNAITSENFLNIANDSAPLLGSLLENRKGTLASLSKAIDVAGTATRIPSKFLTAADEYFKQINFRARARTILFQEAENLAIPLAQRPAFIAEKMDRIIRGGQAYTTNTIRREYEGYLNDHLRPDLRQDPNAVEAVTNQFFWSGQADPGALAISEAAQTRAREVTFTDEAGKLTGLLNAAKNLPVVGGPFRLIMPFVTTPVNLIKFAARRTIDPAFGSAEFALRHMFGKEGPTLKITNALREARGLPNLQIQKGISSFARDFASKDPVVAADALGRWAMGAGLVYLGVQWATAAHDPNATFGMTGRGPTEPNLRRQWLNENQEYPFFVGSGKDRQWFQYSRFDPVALVLGPLADMVSYSHFAPIHEQTRINALMGAMLAGIANIADKTWLSGVQNTLDVINSKDPYKIGSVMNNFAGSWIPGALASPAWTGPEGDTLREVRKLSDAFLNRTPWTRDQLMPQRNSLGEPLPRKKQAGENEVGKWISFFSPIRTSHSGNDQVMAELNRTGHGFSPTEDQVDFGGVNVDLRQFTLPSGQTLDDRYAELVGTTRISKKTLREALSLAINNPQYKKLPEFHGDNSLENPKVQVLGSFFSAYRGVAKAQLYKESKELQDFVKHQLQVTRQGYQGAR